PAPSRAPPRCPPRPRAAAPPRPRRRHRGVPAFPRALAGSRLRRQRPVLARRGLLRSGRLQDRAPRVQEGAVALSRRQQGARRAPQGRLLPDQARGPEGRPGLARAGGGALPEDRRREARREAAEGGSMRAAFALLALLPAAAWAQMPTVDPSGREPAAPPPTAAPGSSTGVPGGIYGIDRPAPAPQPPEIRVVVPPGGQ